ncbi:DNA replication factor Dna2 [Macrophomina phaseolina MS6]|uniref:DNA replication ATP-dependent helicase/nuclease n=1 Tax=Macrophomina phaseolina (strain MS6) TaxID=1126212 RepID=K2S2D5_MACPH|nr:DNA replication factor Dna2 [Macrophomina phaseolina MS6]
METPVMTKSRDWMMDSSPPNEGTVRGLRRYASYHERSTTTRRKKPKTTGTFRPNATEDEHGNVEATNFQPRPSSAWQTSVQLLRERLEQPSKLESNAPSSSEPLPDVSAFPSSAPQLSPSHGRGLSEEADDAEQELGNVEEQDADAELQNEWANSDEFDDVEFEEDVFEEAMAIASTAQNAHRSIPEPQIEQAPLKDPSGEAGPPQVLATAAGLEEGAFDEFDAGGDFESIIEDAEDAVSQLESRLLAPVDVRNSDEKVHLILDDDDDEYGDDEFDLDELEQAEREAAQKEKNSAVSSESDRRARTIQRYLVTDIVYGHYAVADHAMQPEKVFLVEDERTKKLKAITLREAWYDTPCEKGSYVHVIGDFTSGGQCIIDNDNNMIILHPDYLISATTIGDSFSCMRKAVLQDRIKATSDANESAMVGTILHELFQEALKANCWDHEWLVDLIQRIIPRKFETILEIGLTFEHVVDRLVSKIPQIQGWARIFVKARPGPDAVVKDRNGKTVQMSVNKLLEVEEHIWSPMYGLKGNIDASVQVLMHDESGERTLTVPFELKTGRAVNISHQAQTALYTLLMSDRYDVDILYGVLFYLESSDISRIRAIRHEIRQMIIQRNEIACYVRERLKLPPMIADSHQCNRCYAQETCFLYHRLAEDGSGETLGMPAKQKFEELVRNLKVPHQDFFQKWDLLLTKEESEMKRFHRELWTMLSEEREKLGRCFSNVVVDPGSFKEVPDGQKINRFQYSVIKHSAPANFSFTESQITVGEPIVISDEMGHFALANGYVVSVRKSSITVAVDRRLHNARIKQHDFDPLTRQSFVGLMDVTGGAVVSSKPAEHEDEPILYRLDKDEFSNGMALVRNNLIQLMNDSDFRSSILRALIVDGKAPTFKPSSSGYSIQGPSQHLTMNSDQVAAVEKVFSAQDYALVLGMPGTGKTTTIAHIIRSLVAKGKSVLLTSYTHTAVDNILLKIRNDGIGILRLGAAAKIHPEVQDFATVAAHPASSLEELERTWKEPPVVATTCLTINHPIFRRRLFDYCIVDEASQITLPVCLGPIRMAKRFILVGDHYQLPPLVQNKEAQEGGLDVSLFRLLSEAHPDAVVNLEHQYRMCAEIMLLSNTLIYDGRLKCGNDAVANRSLSIPNFDALQRHHHLSTQPQRGHSGNPFSAPIDSASTCTSHMSSKCWLTHALSPSNKVLFLNTDNLAPASEETLAGSRILNQVECTLTTQLVESLITTGVPASEIGIITFYRSQLALLRHALRHRTPALELHTADKFQGRDKEVVIVSCVRNNEQCNVGELLKDWRRVNVAVTRARSKLVLVGSKKTLSRSGEKTLKGLVSVCEDKGWMRDLKVGDIEAHVFEEWGTQTQRTSADGVVPASPVDVRSPVKAPKSGGPLASRDQNAVAKSLGSPVKKRKAFGVSGGNGSGARSKVPEKRGRVGQKAMMSKRPVLRDIFNDVLGENV